MEHVVILAYENPFKRLRTGGAECMYRSLVALPGAGVHTRVLAVDRDIDDSVGRGVAPDLLVREFFPRQPRSPQALVRALRWPWPTASRYTEGLARRIRELDLTDATVIVEGVQMCAYWDLVRRARPRRTVLRMLNIESRYHQQMARAGTPLRAMLHRIVGAQYRLVERVIAEFDDVVTISTDEYHETRRRLPSRSERVHLVPPVAVGTPRPAGYRSSGRPADLCYFGDLTVPANRYGIDWFLAEVWPTIRARVPEAVFRLAGMGTRDISGERVEGLGFAPSLDTFVHDSALMVIPLQHGAGVKMKTIDAIKFRIPVVCTSVAVEGTAFAVAPGRDTLVVRDDADAFASGVMECLREPAAAAARATAALAIVERDHSADRLAQALGFV